MLKISSEGLSIDEKAAFVGKLQILQNQLGSGSIIAKNSISSFSEKEIKNMGKEFNRLVRYVNQYEFEMAEKLISTAIGSLNELG